MFLEWLICHQKLTLSPTLPQDLEQTHASVEDEENRIYLKLKTFLKIPLNRLLILLTIFVNKLMTVETCLKFVGVRAQEDKIEVNYTKFKFSVSSCRGFFLKIDTLCFELSHSIGSSLTSLSTL